MAVGQRGIPILRIGIAAVFLISMLGIDCIKRGPFGEEEQDIEDHTFLIELKNTTRVSVTFREVDTDLGFIVEGTDSGFIRRMGQPGQVFRYTARLGFFGSDTIGCTYHPPSETTPMRRVEWDGNDIRCAFWEP
jgi:hypothetical protein